MILKLPLIVLLASLVNLRAEDAAWKSKPVPEWTAADAEQVLTDSPWTRTVTPTVERQSQDRQPGSGGGRRGGIGIGGVGFPGGMGRRGGYPGGGYPGGGRSGRTDEGGDRRDAGSPPALKVRWESALPVREAELKARDTDAPTLAEGQYAIAVYGVPGRMVNSDTKSFADQLKKAATLKRDGKKDLKPSRVEVLQREDGPVILYQFPRTKEITQPDRRVEFAAHIGRLQFAQSFYLEDMVYLGQLEL
jgi:hypothetical protein